MEEIRFLLAKISDIEHEIKIKLAKRWPVDSTIFVMLNARQIMATPMTVVGHSGRGYVTAWMESRKSRNDRYVRQVFFKDIVS